MSFPDISSHARARAYIGGQQRADRKAQDLPAGDLQALRDEVTRAEREHAQAVILAESRHGYLARLTKIYAAELAIRTAEAERSKEQS